MSAARHSGAGKNTMEKLLFNSKTQVGISLVMLLALLSGVWELSSKATQMTSQVAGLRESVDKLTEELKASQVTQSRFEARLALVETMGSQPFREKAAVIDARVTAQERGLERMFYLLKEHATRTGDALTIPKSADKLPDSMGGVEPW